MKRRNQAMRFGAMSRRFINMIDGDEGGEGGGGEAGAGDAGGDTGDAGAGDDSPGSGDGAPVDYFATVPEDWRSQALTKAGYEAGDDFDKAMKQLDRVSDIGVFTKNYLSAQEKIRAGEVSTGLPENPTDEQMSDYREANGIPQTPEDYSLTLEEGLVLGEGDEETLADVYKIAHKGDVKSEVMSDIVNSMLRSEQAKVDAMVSQDGIDQQMTQKQLKEAWGGDFTTNLNVVSGLINQLPESIKEQFESARMPDGKAVFNSPEMMVAMAEWARKINPSATVVPNSANPMQTMTDEIKALEGKMGTPEWYKDLDSQKRYQDLVTAKERMAS